MALKLLALLMVAVAAEGRVSYRNHKLLEVPVNNFAEADVISQLEDIGFDVWSMVIGKAAYVRVAPWELAYVNNTLREIGRSFKIVNHDLQENIDKERATLAEIDTQRGRSSWVGNTYVRYSEIVSWILSLPATYGNKVAVQNIGKTYENRDMYVVRLSNNIAQSGNRKVIFLESNIHAREWLTHATIAYFIEVLLNNYGVNTRITAALDNFEWNFVVVSNPDGYEFTHTEDRLWRKTRSRNGNCYGVDPNRNFDSHFCEVGASKNPCNRETYCGPAAFSEKETAAIRDYTTSIKDRMVVFQSVHTYGQIILLPFGYARGALPPDFSELKRVADLMASAIFQTSRRVYTPGNIAATVGPVGGGSVDWAREALNTKYVHAFELRPAQGDPIGFEAPPSEIVPTAEEFLAAQLTLVENIKL